MREEPLPALEQAFDALRQFTRVRRSPSRAVEQCELCSAGLAQEHPHLVQGRFYVPAMHAPRSSTEWKNQSTNVSQDVLSI
jgi:hypothetical protein